MDNPNYVVKVYILKAGKSKMYIGILYKKNGIGELTEMFTVYSRTPSGAKKKAEEKIWLFE